jgi:hypothetical protein
VWLILDLACKFRRILQGRNPLRLAAPSPSSTGRRGGCWSTLTLLFLLVATSASATVYEPGAAYFGRNDYVEYRPGNLPIILTAGHGGTLRPAEIPDRTWGVIAMDTNTRPLTEAIAAEITRRTGKYPHVIISHLHRIKLDPNREIPEAAQGNVFAEQAWQEFHGFIKTARATAEAEFGFGYLTDIHGHAHDIKRLELGYGLGNTELNLTDSQLEAPGYGWNSSLRTLLLRNPGLNFPAVLRGPRSLGQLFNDRGVPAWPSADFPTLGDAPFFNGGFITREHTCFHDNGPINGVQIESHFEGIRDTSANRTAFAQNYSRVMQPYLWDNYAYSLGTLSLYRFRAGATSFSKGGEMLVFNVDRTGYGAYSDTLNINLEGTAVRGIDYLISTTSLSFANGQTSASFAILPLAPNGEPGDKTIELRLAPGYRQTADTSPVVLTLGDGFSQTVRIDTSSAEVFEHEGRAFFRLSRTTADGPLTVNLHWSGSAVPGLDYDLPWELPATAIFAQGVFETKIPVTLVNDAIPEADKTIVLEVKPGADYLVGDSGKATILLRDDDWPHGIQVWLRGEVTENQLLDSSGFSRHATTLPAGRGPVSVSSPGGSAFAFDGSVDTAALPKFTLDSGAGFTVAFHFRISSSANTNQNLLSFGERGGPGSLNIYFTSASNLRTWLRSESGNETASSLDISASWMNGQWRHYALVADPAGAVRIYINGQLVRTANGWTGTLDPREILWLGWARRAGNAGGFLHGEMRDFRSYDRPLAAAEIMEAATGRMTFPAWQAFHGLPPALNPLMDLNGNGMPLLLEYGLGGDPLAPLLPPRYQTRLLNGRMQLLFLHQSVARDLEWRVEGTDSLKLTWETLAHRPANASIWTIAPGAAIEEYDDFIIVKDREPAPGSTGRFMRLRAILSP